ncbi:hypothetical protein [Nitrosopumilus zosterae]|nr:hypothetical protein [Nitrosopumilus zosterae]BDQ31080.1 hypothetical protein NZOSNM25_001190 [Nitrosopumilus zosterae]
MQNMHMLFGLTGIFFIGLIPYGMSDSDEQYLQLKEIYDEQRWNLEKEFEEKFQESRKYFDEQKQAIHDKNESDSPLTPEQTDQMLKDIFFEFIERQEEIKIEYTSRVDALNAMFKIKFEQFGNEMPLWVEKVMELWQKGKISDVEFVNFLSFVINNDIIKLEQWIFSEYNH